jgi:hypothetical protein
MTNLGLLVVDLAIANAFMIGIFVGLKARKD